MSITFVSTHDYPSGKIIEFDIESTQDVDNKEIKSIYDQLVFQEAFSYGKIYKRKDNEELWYINPNETTARFITQEQLNLFHQWDKQPLLPTEQQFEILKQIGGLPSSPYSLDPKNLQFPALVTTNSGQQIDLCLFHFSQSPPFQRYFKKVILLSDIAEIKPSSLALNHSLRLASTLADEIRMSFFPFMVKTNTGSLLTYNGTTQFASKGEIKGDEIVSEVNFSYDYFDKLSDVSFYDITYIIGKWDNRLDELFNQYTQQLKKESNANINPENLRQTWWQKILGWFN